MTDPLRSTALRLAGLYGLAFALVAAGLGYTIYSAARVELVRQLDARIATEQRTLIHAFGAGGAPALARAVSIRAAHGGRGEMRYSLLDRAGWRTAGAPVAIAARTGWADADFRYGGEKADLARALITPLPGGATLVVGADADSVERIDRRMVQLFELAFGAMIAIALVGGLALSATFRRRLDTIRRTAQAIVEGDLDHRIPVRGSRDEFDRLSATLNAMLDRIGALVENLRRVSSDVAHDLRTPLSRLRQKLELAFASEDDDPIALRQAIAAAIERTDEILSLFGAILSLSDVETGTSRLGFGSVALSTLVAEIAESYVPSAEEGGRSLARRVQPDLCIAGDRGLLAQLAVNLLDNALAHTPKGTHVEIMLERNDEAIVLTVADNGPGIIAAEREAVFRRFLRLETSRSTPGHGLGLSLVRAIAHAHRGRVALTDNRPGVRIEVTFPPSDL